MDGWYFQQYGMEHGPIAFERLVHLWRTGAIEMGTPLRQGPSGEWVPASSAILGAQGGAGPSAAQTDRPDPGTPIRHLGILVGGAGLVMVLLPVLLSMLRAPANGWLGLIVALLTNLGGPVVAAGLVIFAIGMATRVLAASAGKNRPLS